MWLTDRLRKTQLAYLLYKLGVLSIDSIYGERYYAGMDRKTAIRDAEQLADAVIDIYNPSNIIAFGCGTGRMLYPYFDQGIAVRGLDASKLAFQNSELPRDCFRQHDLTEKYHSEKIYDVALAFEILEHLPESTADTAVSSVAGAAKTVLVSAAKPGQGGTHHVNEQPKEYWIEKFENEEMKFNPVRTEEIRDRVTMTDLDWIEANLLIFEE